jgi:hypothetical protein
MMPIFMLLPSARLRVAVQRITRGAMPCRAEPARRATDEMTARIDRRDLVALRGACRE